MKFVEGLNIFIAEVKPDTREPQCYVGHLSGSDFCRENDFAQETDQTL